MKLRLIRKGEPGYRKGAKRRVNADIEHITKRTKIYSDRQAANIKLRERTGRKTLSKEAFTRAVKQGELPYSTPGTAKAQAHIRNSKSILKFVPQMTPRDLKLANKWQDVGFSRLSHKEQMAFRQLFKRYEADAVRQAFGSNPRDTGSFNVAA